MPSLVEIGPVVLKKKIFKVRQCIFAIFLLSPLEKGRSPSFEEVESPSPKNASCQVWLKLAQWFLRRRFLKFVNVFLLFHYYLCLLYTSDAADDMQCVDLGGRRIIKKIFFFKQKTAYEM